MVFQLKTKGLMSCLGGLIIVEVKYYLIVHSMLHLKPSLAQEPFISSIFYVSILYCVMLFYTDENINYVNCVGPLSPLLFDSSLVEHVDGRLIRVQQAGQYNADAVLECGFTATLLIIHGGFVREKL